MKGFNDLADFTLEEISDLLALAGRLDERPEPRALAGKVLALLFLSRSLRTLTSFQAAMTRLGGGAFVVSPEMSIHGLETRSGIVMDGVAAEHIHEAVPVIASYGDAIGIRAPAELKNIDDDLADSRFRSLTALVDTPFINMESAANHPCQVLADWKTMDDLGVPASGGQFVLSWAYHPDPLPLSVPGAVLHMAAMRGMDVTVLRPEGFGLPDALMERARSAARISGGSVGESEERDAALAGAHVVYARSWVSTAHYGDRVADSTQRRKFPSWRVDERWFAGAHAQCRYMHCLPVRRGVEVEDEILDGARSAVTHQARNRMLAQMAVLHRMLVGAG
ncbi:MAG TPA: N-acetylornithine carbamoyltransferase [Gammaproteobacteria bacterium]|nr:N-acetylornithine carbamoyltransferase [Gammaproteobacteria bacterium]